MKLAKTVGIALRGRHRQMGRFTKAHMHMGDGVVLTIIDAHRHRCAHLTGQQLHVLAAHHLHALR